MTAKSTGPDYRTALQECGFGAADIERGLQMLESGRYFGFADVVSSLAAFGGSRPAARPHQVDTVVRRVQQKEALSQLDRRAARGQTRMAEQRAEREAEEAERSRLERDEANARSYFFENVTDAEWNASETAYAAAEAGAESPVRPEIANAFRRWKELTEALEESGPSGASAPRAARGRARMAVRAESEQGRRTAVLREEEDRLRNFLVENATDREWDDSRARRPHIAATFRRWTEVSEQLKDTASTSSGSSESGTAPRTEAELTETISEAFGGSTRIDVTGE